MIIFSYELRIVMYIVMSVMRLSVRGHRVVMLDTFCVTTRKPEVALHQVQRRKYLCVVLCLFFPTVTLDLSGQSRNWGAVGNVLPGELLRLNRSTIDTERGRHLLTL